MTLFLRRALWNDSGSGQETKGGSALQMVQPRQSLSVNLWRKETALSKEWFSSLPKDTQSRKMGPKHRRVLFKYFITSV